MSNILNNLPEIEQKTHIEKERKYLPVFPAELLHLRESAVPIEQVYLSHPAEPFSLRLRQSANEQGELTFHATLKDRGAIIEDDLRRLEVEAEISEETFRFYANDRDLPRLRKQRLHIDSFVTIDFYEDGEVMVECEGIARHEWIDQLDSVDITGDKRADNEWRAHFEFRRANKGREALCSGSSWDTATIAQQVTLLHHEQEFVVVTIGGRSGSGKSTIVRELQRHLASSGVNTDVLSTDDYHRGKKWLEAHNNGQPWTKWDAPIVYDLAALRNDIEQLRKRETIPRRKMDFIIEEPAVVSTLPSPDVLIVEGIYAVNDELRDVVDIRYEIPTPLATCIGRRLLRDMEERPQFSNPEKSLRYILEHAEPAYRHQLKQ